MAGVCPRCGSRPGPTVDECATDGTALVEDLAGRVLAGRFRLRALLGGSGVRGTMWQADDLLSERAVAVRVAPAEAAALGRRVGRALGALRANHPAIVPVLDAGVLPGGELYVASELVQGPSLAVTVRRGRVRPTAALAIAARLLEALAHAHERDIVHGALHPGCVFVPPTTGPWGLRLADFGVPLDAVGAAGAVGAIGATRAISATAAADRADSCDPDPHYISPEQVRGRAATPRSDLYGVGLLLFTLVTGRVPFTGVYATDIYRRHLFAPPPLFTDVAPDIEPLPAGFEALVTRALAKAPSERYISATAMREATLQALRQAAVPDALSAAAL